MLGSCFIVHRLRLSEGGEGLRLDAMVSEAESSGEEAALMTSDDENGEPSTSKRRGRAFQHPGRACDSRAQAVQFALHP